MSQVSYVTNKGLPGLPILRLDSNMVEITRDYNSKTKLSGVASEIQIKSHLNR